MSLGSTAALGPAAAAGRPAEDLELFQLMRSDFEDVMTKYPILQVPAPASAYHCSQRRRRNQELPGAPAVCLCLALAVTSKAAVGYSARSECAYRSRL